MTFEKAIKQSIKKYFEGVMPNAYIEANGGSFTYTPEYFDDLEKEADGQDKESKGKGKKEEDVVDEHD